MYVHANVYIYVYLYAACSSRGMHVAQAYAAQSALQVKPLCMSFAADPCMSISLAPRLAMNASLHHSLSPNIYPACRK